MKETTSTGKLVSRDHARILEIPASMLETCGDANTLLVIYTPRADALKISVIPTRSNQILKVTCHLHEFFPQTAKYIAEIICDLHVATVYTSGICFEEEGCYYEAYVSSPSPVEGTGGLRERFLRVPGCHAVDVAVLTVS